MPIYEYVCGSCARRIEVIHGIDSPRPQVCEVCGGPLRKALSTPSIVFKGSGWAKKDAQSAPGGGRPATASGTPGGEAATTTPSAPPAPGTSGGTSAEPATKGSGAGAPSSGGSDTSRSSSSGGDGASSGPAVA